MQLATPIRFRSITAARCSALNAAGAARQCAAGVGDQTRRRPEARLGLARRRRAPLPGRSRRTRWPSPGRRPHSISSTSESSSGLRRATTTTGVAVGGEPARQAASDSRRGAGDERHAHARCCRHREVRGRTQDRSAVRRLMSASRSRLGTGGRRQRRCHQFHSVGFAADVVFENLAELARQLDDVMLPVARLGRVDRGHDGEVVTALGAALGEGRDDRQVAAHRQDSGDRRGARQAAEERDRDRLAYECPGRSAGRRSPRRFRTPEDLARSPSGCCAG